MALATVTGSFLLKQSTAINRPFFFGTTGQTVAVTLSKGAYTGGATPSAFAAMHGNSGNAIEIANGWYYAPFDGTDTAIQGFMCAHCTAASGGPADFQDEVLPQLFTDFNIAASSGRANCTNVLQQNQAVPFFPFTMTKAGVPIPGIGGTITAQRNFGAGWSNMAHNGSYTDAGFGDYFIALDAVDTNSVAAIYRFTSPSADDNNVIVFFSP